MQFYAKDIMSEGIIAVHPEMTCRDAMQLFLGNRIGGAPVVDNRGILVGVLSLMDLVSATLSFPTSPDYFMQEHVRNQKLEEIGFHIESDTEGLVSDVMSRQLYTAKPDTPMETLARDMYKHQIHRIIIVNPDNSRPVGIVTTFDLLKVMAEGESLQDVLPEQEGWLKRSVS